MKKRGLWLFVATVLVPSVLLVALIPTASKGEQIEEKKVVMIIAQRNFRDEELQEPKAILERREIKVTVASSSKDTAIGLSGATVKPDILISEIKTEEYDAIIFVGGPGAIYYWYNPTAHKIAKEAIEKGKILAAISIAPVTLANAGVLKDKKATVWPSEAYKLIEKGAIYTGAKLQVDDNIITAVGPEEAEEFGEAIVKALIPVVQRPQEGCGCG